MTTQALLRTIDGGRVVDIATGDGGFVHTLIDGLARYDDIIGIDVDPRQRERFERAFAAQPGVRLVEADVQSTGFPDGSFDDRRLPARGEEIRSRLRDVRIGGAHSIVVVGTSEASLARRLAERAGFEPAMGCPIPHFQCGALGH
jgi:methyltransferase family protein